MTILEEINEVKKEEVKKLRSEFTLSRFSDSEFYSKSRISFYNALHKNNELSIIAEIKKASPSKGIIRKDFEHVQIANIYLENEVDAISVLTDRNFFMGSINYLYEIAKFKTVPILRKDFIIDEYQVFEAKANGADAILLIAESLSVNQINELTAAAKECDLEVLLELHSLQELQKVNFEQNKVIGINNRDLKNFNVDLTTTEIIGQHIPDENLIISESGIKTKNDIETLKKTKTKAILVGEHLMISQNINDSIRELQEWCKIEN